jgi:PKD repeat protein
MAANGIGDGPDPGGHSGFSWIDCIEWTFVDIGTTFTTGGNPYYPGSAYVTWVMADPYNWAGGSYCPQQKTGQVPQLGDNVCTSMWGPNNSHYNQAWSTFKDTVQHILDWSDNNPDPLLGLGEFSTSHLIDRWTINTRNAQNVLIDPGHAEGVLITPVTATAQPLAAGEWYKNVTRVLQGLNHLSGTSAVNQFTADPRGTRLKLIHGWNSQEKAPRWINGAAFATGDTTGPTTTGSTRSSMLTGWVTMANDTFWDAGAPPPTDPPSGAAITALVDPGDSMTWNFTGSVTQGTGSITGYDWSFGAGGGTSTLQNPSCTYTTPGIKNITFTVTDSNSLSASATRTITVIDPGGGGGGSGGGGAMAGYQYIRPGGLDQYVDFRLIYNPNLDKTEVVFAALAARLDALEGGGGGGGGSVVGTPVLGTLVEDAAVTTTNVPYPAGITANQLLVAFMSHGAITTATNPSGWTQVYNSVRGALQPALWVGIKTATGTESGSLAVVHPSAVAMGRMMRVPNVNVANPQDATATTIQVATASTTTVLPTLATNHAGTLLVAIAAQNSGTANASTCASTGATWTEDADRNTGTRAATMWHSARGASGGTGDVTITWSGAATSHGVLIALRPV